MKQLVVALLAGAIATAAVSEDRPFASWLLESASSVEVWKYPKEGSTATWRLVSREGVALAEMKQPQIPRGFVVNYGDCKVSGVIRSDVLAIVKHQKRKEWSADVRSVWVADPQAKAFVGHSPAGVVCRNEGHGV